MSEILLFAAFSLCVYAAATDIKRLEIDNWVSLALIGLFALYALLTPVVIVAHIATFLVVLLLGLGLHKSGVMGGGDVKLLTALSLWAGLSGLPILLMATSIAGALVAGMTLLLQNEKWLPRAIVPADTGLAWVDGARAGGQNVAYGIAIAMGAACLFLHLGGL